MPTRETPWPTGTPCWVDLGTPEPDAARAFYASFLDWTYSGGDPEYGGYWICLRDGRKAAGLGPQMGPDAPVAWTTYFAADDVDAVVERVVAAGGTVIAPPMDVGPAGRMAIAADPQGNGFGIWQSGETTGVEVFNEPGSLVWNEAAVDDPASARQFYGAVFGFAWTEVPEAGGYTTFSLDERPLGGLGGVSAELPTGWAACFSVASCDAAVEAVTAGGGRVLLAAQDTGFGRFAVVADPWGASFSVMSELPG